MASCPFRDLWQALPADDDMSDVETAAEGPEAADMSDVEAQNEAEAGCSTPLGIVF